MKLAKLSLVAMMAMGTVAYANSDALADAFKNGTVSGQLRFEYTGGSNSDALIQTAPVNNVNVGSIGAELRYVTDSFKGFKLGLGFQTAHDLDWQKSDATSPYQPEREDDPRNSVSTTLLSEAYIQYSFLKSDIKVGRQKIKTPLIMTSTAFVLEDSFDAAVLTLNEIPDTMIKLIYIQEWQMRYGSDAVGNSQQDEHFSDGMYSVFFVNKSIKGLKVDGQYLTTNQDRKYGAAPYSIWDAPIFIKAGGYDEYYLQAEYKLPIDFPLSLAMTYAGAHYDNPLVTGKDNATLYGFQAGTEISGVKINAAYTTMDEEANFPGTFGHVPDAIAYTDMLTNNAIFAGVDAYSIEAIYGFGIPGFSSALKYAYYTQSDEGYMNSGTSSSDRMYLDGASEIDLDLKYKFSGALKGFATRLWAGYGTYDHVSGEDSFTYARFYLSYSF